MSVSVSVTSTGAIAIAAMAAVVSHHIVNVQMSEIVEEWEVERSMLMIGEQYESGVSRQEECNHTAATCRRHHHFRGGNQRNILFFDAH